MARPRGKTYTEQKIVLMTPQFRKKVSFMAAVDGLFDAQLIRKALVEYEKQFDSQRNDKRYLPGACADGNALGAG
jgi:hypothetical protein